VLSVELTENHNPKIKDVHVNMDIMKEIIMNLKTLFIQIGVDFVSELVILVNLMTFVTHVLISEKISHSVLVQKVGSMMVSLVSVEDVNLNVNYVQSLDHQQESKILNLSVLNVNLTLTDLLSLQIVSVLMDMLIS
jgi:hypothetical protein